MATIRYRNLFILLICYFIVSCNSGIVFTEYKELGNTWHQDSSLVYNFKVPDTTQYYDLVLDITYDILYPYQNFYFNFTLKNSQDYLFRDEMKEMIFFENKTGKPLGDGLGDLFSKEYTLLKKFKFKQSSKYQLEINQFMRLTELPYIQRVGFFLKKSE